MSPVIRVERDDEQILRIPCRNSGRGIRLFSCVHIPWGVANSGVSTGFSTYERRRNNITGTLSQPRRPCGPPGIRMRLHRRLPLIRRHVSITGRAGMDLILAVTSAGLAHDAAVVSSSGQHESQLGRRQEMQLVNRAPRRNMIRAVPTQNTGTAMSPTETGRPVTG